MWGAWSGRHDAFTNEAFTDTSINYEKAAVLFNLGALFSQMAELQNRCAHGLGRAATCTSRLNRRTPFTRCRATIAGKSRRA